MMKLNELMEKYPKESDELMNITSNATTVAFIVKQLEMLSDMAYYECDEQALAGKIKVAEEYAKERQEKIIEKVHE